MSKKARPWSRATRRRRQRARVRKEAVRRRALMLDALDLARAMNLYLNWQFWGVPILTVPFGVPAVDVTAKPKASE